MPYSIGDELPLNAVALRERDKVGLEVAIIARGGIINGLIGVGCHQHPLSALIRNGATVTEDPDRANDDRPLLVTAYATIADRDNYPYMAWRNKVRGNTGMDEIVQYAHRIEVVGLPSEPVSPADDTVVTHEIQAGFYACATHSDQHYYVIVDRRSGNNVIRLDTSTGHGGTRGLTSNPDCILRRGASMSWLLNDIDARHDLARNVSIQMTERQRRESEWTA